MFPTIERAPRRSMYNSAIRNPALGSAFLRLGRMVDLAAGLPVASRSATRVSAPSTLTSTCFFTWVFFLYRLSARPLKAEAIRASPYTDGRPPRAKRGQITEDPP